MVWHQIDRRWFWLFFIALMGLAIVLAMTGHIFLDEPDDPYLRLYFLNGDARTHIMSMPMGRVMADLYGRFPDVPWISWLFIGVYTIIAALYAAYVAAIGDKFLRIVLTILGALMALYLLMRMSITILTLTLVVVAMPLLSVSLAAFFTLTTLAVLLRDDIVVTSVPFFVVAFLLIDKKRPTWRELSLSLPFIVAILLIIFAPHEDGTYERWLGFNDARAYFKDFDAPPKNGALGQDEMRIARSWFIQDEALVPADKMIEASGGLSDVIAHDLSTMTIRSALGLLKGRIEVLIFILFSIIMYFYCKKRRLLLLYLIYFGGLYLLFIVRNVDRVIIPLLLLWFTVLFLDFYRSRSIEMARLLSFFFVIAILFHFHFGFHRHSDERVALRDEMFTLLSHHPEKMVEPSLGFPTNIRGKLMAAFSQNALFREKEWISTYILPAGWMSRSPLFYKTHDITFGGVKRKYRDYHEYLTSPRASFIGTKTLNTVFVERVLHLYDRIYCHSRKCRHVVQKLDCSRHFCLYRVRMIFDRLDDHRPKR